MTQIEITEITENTNAGRRWKDLYRLAGIAAIISEIIILLGIVTYFIWPYAPGNQSVQEIFLSLQDNPFGGLVSLDLFLYLGNLFNILLFLALYVSLRTTNDSYALVALAVGLVGVVLLIPARPLFEMFALSKLYAAATDPALKDQYLASGRTLLLFFDGTGWIMNTLLGGISLLVSSLLMLRSRIFSRATAYVGIITNLAACIFFPSGRWCAAAVPVFAWLHRLVFPAGSPVFTHGSPGLNRDIKKFILMSLLTRRACCRSA